MPALKKLVVNYEDEKPRKGRLHHFESDPAPVYRWGYYGVTYPEGSYQEMYDWYTKTLTLTPSDVVYKDEEPIACSFHIDRGLEFTDHHAFFFKRVKPDAKPSIAHAAFEIHDFDVQQLGHNYLESKGCEVCWGVGRHVLGSQVFDYWLDPSGFIVEHYADGDLVNVESGFARPGWTICAQDMGTFCTWSLLTFLKKAFLIEIQSCACQRNAVFATRARILEIS